MSPDGFFRKKNVFVFLNSLVAKRPKSALKKSIKNKNKIEQVTTCFLAPQQMYVTFVIFFRPLARCLLGHGLLVPWRKTHRLRRSQDDGMS
jgi:hypothetical protein